MKERIQDSQEDLITEDRNEDPAIEDPKENP